MAWFALYNTASGQILSVGTVIADPLPAGVTLLQLAGQPSDNEMWDQVNKTFVVRPAKVLVDRLDDLLADTDFASVWNNLSAARKTALRTALIKLLGSQRFRAQSEQAGL